MKKRIIGCIVFAAMALGLNAQNGTKSPYSQFGIGVLSDQSESLGRGMNGTGVGVAVGNMVNTLNPASYAGIDSLTMLFDAGLTAQFTHFKEGEKRKNSSTANFDYVVGSFRAWKNVGVAFGLLPVSSVGYSYSSTMMLGDDSGSMAETYSGSGGLRQAFIGVGGKLWGPLSAGVNVGYLWGSIDRQIISQGTSSYVNSLSRTYSMSVNSYKIDMGVQWAQRIGKGDRLTLGATLGVGHKLNASPAMTVVSSAGVKGDTIGSGVKLPMTYGLGASLLHSEKLLVAADVTLQKWGSLAFPAIGGDGSSFAMTDGLLKDRYKISAGMDWAPAVGKSRFLQLMHYRMGAAYSTPYYKINGQDGPKELSATMGFGIPILNRNSINLRSVLNVSAQWVHTSAPGLITENSFRINIGLTFNERWFMKWKFE